MTRSLPEPVRSLDAKVISTLNQRTDTAIDDLTSYLAQVSSPESARLVIDAICENGELSEQCYRSALTHPLGFDRFLLLVADAYDLRLHIWWPDRKGGREDIHNHRFSLFSGIITGELQISTYEIDRCGITMRRYEEVHYGGDGDYRYIRQGDVCVKRTNVINLQGGSAYYLSSRILHQVTTECGTITATLFIRATESYRTSLVLRGAGEPAPKPGIRTTLGRSEAEKRIRSFLEVLSCPMAEAKGPGFPPF